MPDLRITVTTESAQLQKIIDQLNTTGLTSKELNTQMRNLKETTKLGSQEMKDMGDVLAQVREQSKSAAAQENSFGNVIRQNRQERRLYMFAINEGLAAITAATGGENQFAKAITSGAGAVFGMKFALDAMGLSAAAAWPVAIIVAAWSVISGIISTHKKETEELNTLLRENLDLEIKLGNVAPEAGVSADTTALVEAKKKLADLQRLVTNTYVNRAGQTFSNTTTAGTATEIAQQINLIDKLQLKISEGNKKIADENGKALDDFKNQMDQQIAGENKSDETINKTTESIKDQTSAMWQLGKLTDAQYYSILLQRREQARIVGDLETQVKLQEQLEKFQLGGAGSASSMIGNTGGSISKIANTWTGEHVKKGELGAIDNTPYAAAIAGSANPKKTTAEVMGEYLTDPLKSGFQSVTQSALEGMNRMWEKSSGFASTVLGRAFESIADSLLEKVANELEGGAVEGLLGLIGLAGGGDFSYGSQLQFAANGINFRYGNGIQNIVVGEQGKELLQVGRNGGRVISNKNFQRASQGNTASGNSSDAMASALNALASRLQPASAFDVYFAVKKAGNIRNNGMKM